MMEDDLVIITSRGKVKKFRRRFSIEEVKAAFNKQLGEIYTVVWNAQSKYLHVIPSE